MNIKEAYEKVKNTYYSDEDVLYLVSCMDFGEFWGFGFSSEPRENGGVCYGYAVVFKSNGAVDILNPWNDKDGVKLMDNAIEIPIDEVLSL